MNTNADAGTYRGCRLLMPCFCEIAPVIKGRMALPACPKPAIQPIDPVRIQRGRMREAWFMAIGYIGPSKAPMIDTAIAFPTSDGTNQMTSSSLVIDLVK